MTEKQKNSLNKIISALPDNCRELFREVAEYAVFLEYKPKLNAKETYADFIKSKHGRTILKIETAANPPRLAMRFDALPVYSGIFREAIENRVNLLEQFDWFKGSCHGCGKCDRTQGYTYELPDGRKGFFCGSGVIDLPSFSNENIAEIKNALKTQDNYFMNLFVQANFIQPKIVKLDKRYIVGLFGNRSKQSELWKDFDELYAKEPFTKADEYKCSIYFWGKNPIPNKNIFFGFESGSSADGNPFDTIEIPACEWAVFEVNPAKWWVSGDKKVEGWVANNTAYHWRNYNGAVYQLEYYKEKFKGGRDPDSLMEVWYPLEKREKE